MAKSGSTTWGTDESRWSVLGGLAHRLTRETSHMVHANTTGAARGGSLRASLQEAQEAHAAPSDHPIAVALRTWIERVDGLSAAERIAVERAISITSDR